MVAAARWLVVEAAWQQPIDHGGASTRLATPARALRSKNFE